jgi:hypothetical protein
LRPAVARTNRKTPLDGCSAIDCRIIFRLFDSSSEVGCLCLVWGQLLLVHAAEGLVVKVRVLSAVLDPRLVVHAHDVGVLVVGQGKAGVGKEPALDMHGIIGVLKVCRVSIA